MKQKTIGLASLLKLNPLIAKYEEIEECIQKLSYEIKDAS
jgi:hypothetical protein